MAATHFHGDICPLIREYHTLIHPFAELFESGFLNPSPQLMFGNMEVRVDPEATEVEDQITYLYNLRLGRSISSFGTL